MRQAGEEGLKLNVKRLVSRLILNTVNVVHVPGAGRDGFPLLRPRRGRDGNLLCRAGRPGGTAAVAVDLIVEAARLALQGVPLACSGRRPPTDDHELTQDLAALSRVTLGVVCAWLVDNC